jgi:predicted amidohydrolase YtcJ
MVSEMSAPHIAPEEDLHDLLTLSADRPELPTVIPYRGELVSSVEQARAIAARFAVPGRVPLVGLAGDLCADGSIGSRTAALRAPYADDPSTSGYAYLSADQIRDHVVACTRAGLISGFHVIGDAGLDAVLAGYSAAAQIVGLDAIRTGLHRLEHVEMADAAAIAELHRLGIAASVQPVFDGWWGGDAGLYAARLGPDRGPRLNPYADMLRAGVPLMSGSDTPVTPYDPWGAVRAMLHHHDPDQRVSFSDAIGTHLGSITPGTSASYAVWDLPGGAIDGLPDLSPGTPEPICLRTVVRGHLAYQREGALE